MEGNFHMSLSVVWETKGGGVGNRVLFMTYRSNRGHWLHMHVNNPELLGLKFIFNTSRCEDNDKLFKSQLLSPEMGLIVVPTS